MNVVDVGILVLLLLGAFAGFRQGFIVEAATIVGVVVALAVARLGYPAVRQLLQLSAPKSPWLTVIAYLIIFVVIWGVFVALARGVRRVARLLFLGTPDRLAGLVLGLLQAAIVVELLLYLSRRIPNHDLQLYFGQQVPNFHLHRLIAQSRLAPTFLQVVPYVDRLFPHAL